MPYSERRRHRAAARALLALDARILDDAGYTRWAIEAELSRPDGPDLSRARRLSRRDLATPPR